MTFAAPFAAANADPLEVKVGVLRVEHSRETISIVDIPPADDFIAGARMAMADNNTTGKFLDQSFSVDDLKLTPDDDAVAAARAQWTDAKAKGFTATYWQPDEQGRWVKKA